MSADIFAPGFKTDPYWWEAAPRPQAPEKPLPAEADVVIVGSGYTGTSAALTLARNGRGVLLLDAEDPGHGASSRNAGYVGRTLWHKFDALGSKFGKDVSKDLAGQAIESHNYVVNLIEKEQIRCYFNYCSRFIAAYTPSHYKKLAKDYKKLREAGLEMNIEMVPREQQRSEIGSDRYYGGMLLHGTGTVHPGLYHLGLLERATASGAEVHGRTKVTNIVRDGDRFSVTTSRGTVKAKDVVVATCGYSGPEVKWFQRRILPIRLFQIATEPLPKETLDRLIPRGRALLDSKTNIYWFRRSPDGTCLIVGGRTGVEEGGLTGKAKALHRAMVEVFPELENVKLTHCWEGQTGFSFDQLPHIGTHDGVHYAMGYCGVGMPMGTYLGHKVGLKVLGKPEGKTPFDGRPFPSRPYYWGKPWFLPFVMAYYNFMDWWDRVRG
ncbi:MAG: NAD(P)/FAD-dependent oxidoreductase [Alphaproteobacteria bacterium]